MSVARTAGRAVQVAVVATLLTVTACGGDQDVDLVGRWVPTEVPSHTFEPDFDLATVGIDFADGTWIGNDGCQDLYGEYSVDSDRFTSPPGSGAYVGCTGNTVPYLELLHRARTVERDGRTIEFRDKKGGLVLVLERSAS